MPAKRPVGVTEAAERRSREARRNPATQARALGYDILAADHGSIWLVEPVTSEAAEWITEHVDATLPMFGRAITVEPRYVSDILFAAEQDGLKVRTL